MDKISQKDIEKITIKEFVSMLIKSCRGGLNVTWDNGLSEYMVYALHHGIIEDYDMVNSNNPIERRAAARIAHEVLLSELGEKDEKDWSAAEKLKDLYQCHTCVIHIAQVYVKGIMTETCKDLFCVNGFLSVADTDIIIERIHNKKERVMPMKSRSANLFELSYEEAQHLICQDNQAMLIDVRTSEEYASGHIEGSISIPVRELINNPFLVNDKKSTTIILYCRSGYQSKLAAKILLGAGYSCIYTIPGMKEVPYFIQS